MIKRIKRYFALRKAQRRFVLLRQMIDAIDNAFKAKGVPSWQRKQFWDDFITSPRARQQFLRDMAKEFNNDVARKSS